jgi:undecaprenyl-diphosphatase
MSNTWLQVMILGIVEGVTEFLPISSTGHLVVTSKLLRFAGSVGGTFEIFIQLGAVLAVAGYYARDLWAQGLAVLGRRPPSKSGDNPPEPARVRRFWLHIALAFLPAAVIGLLLHGWIKRALFSSSVIGATLILGGAVLIFIEKRFRQKPSVTTVMDVSLSQAIGIGLAQTLALVPGVSRSGASIVGGLLLGLDRHTATAFSFYLALPTLGGATIVDLLGSLDLMAADDLYRLALGTFVSLVVAWLSIGWLLRYVSRSTFVSFGIYRIVVGGLLLSLVFTGHL